MSTENNYSDFEKKFEQVWESPGNPEPVANADALYKKVLENIDADISRQQGKIIPWKKIFAAASIVAVVLIAAFLYIGKNTPPAGLNIAANTTGTTQSVTLPDSSVITLGPGAEISYHHEFDKKNRELTLRGTAAFKVIKNHAVPFIVYSGKSVTQVSGTVFSIHNTYGADTVTSIKVTEGKVSFRHQNNSLQEAIYLEKGDSAVLSDVLVKILPSGKADIANRVSLKFRNSSFDNVKDSLETRFNKKFIINKAIRKTVTAEFSDESLETILTVLSVTLDFKFEIRGNTVTIN